MAENAERTLQDMIPEMKELEKLDLFTVNETRRVMKKRREFEYKLRRKTKEKDDFLKYIKYEQSVLDLVRVRRNKRKCVGMRKEIDVCIIRRIHKLYELACRRFPGNLDVWKEHIDFCQKRKERATVEKVFTEAMRLHPHNEEMWILWAKYEMEDNRSPANARRLFQLALRTNAESKQLYKEYFIMELQYADKLRKRQEVLDVELQSTIMKGEVALVVYKNAVVIFPDDVDFCLSCIEICEPFQFSDWIVDHIYNDIKERFERNEIALATIAKRPLSVKDGSKMESEQFAAAMKETCEGFEEGLKQLPTERMWELYVHACIEMAKISPTSSLSTWAINHMTKTFLRAIEVERVTETMCLTWVDMLSKTGQVAWGLEIIPLLTDRFRRSAALWRRQLEFQMICDCDVTAIIASLKESLKHVDKQSESLGLWKLVVDWCMVASPDEVTHLLEEGLTCGSREVYIFIKECYLDWAAQHSNIKSIRKLFQRLSMAPSSPCLFQKYIDLELSQPSPKMKKIRRTFESALLEFGSSDIDIWMKYLELEMKHPLGNPAAVGILYERAKKLLQESLVDDFIQRSVYFSMASTVTVSR